MFARRMRDPGYQLPGFLLVYNGADWHRIGCLRRCWMGVESHRDSMLPLLRFIAGRYVTGSAWRVTPPCVLFGYWKTMPTSSAQSNFILRARHARPFAGYDVKFQSCLLSRN